MKVHPTQKKRNMDSQYDVGSSKKLRRLPHVFARVLELPLHSNADVSVEETSESFRFTATATTTGEDANITNNVRAHTIKIYHGVTKVVITGTDGGDPSNLLDEIDLWRFRLPPSTSPEMTSARYAAGELIVTVPKCRL